MTSPKQRPRRTRLVPLASPLLSWAVVVGFLAAAVVGWGLWRHSIEGARLAEFRAEADAGQRRIADELGRHADLLRGTAGLFESSTAVEAAEFEAFARSMRLASRYPALHAMSWVAARPDGSRPVVYSHSQGGSGVGTDLALTPAARTAMDIARDTGDVALTGSIALVGEPARTGFAIFMPVFGPGPRTDVAERRTRLRGFTTAALRGDLFLANAFRGTALEAELALFVGPSPTGEPLSATGPVHEDTRFAKTLTVARFDQTWTLVATADDGAYDAGRTQSADLLLVAGLLVGLLLFALMRVLGRSEARALQLAADATATLRESEELFRTLATASPTGIFRMSLDGEIIYGNPRLADIAGRPVEGMRLGDSLPVHPDDAERSLQVWETAQELGSHSGRIRIVRADGEGRWVDFSFAAVHDDAGERTGWVGTVQDVTEAAEAAEHTDRLTAIIKATSDLVIISDAKGRTVYANDAAQRVCDLPYGRRRKPGVDFPAHTAAYLSETVLPAVRDTGSWAGEIELLDRDGNPLPVSQVVLSHRDSEGNVCYYSSISRDITAQRRYEAQLAHTQLHDELTGLANRVLFVDRLDHAMARADRRRSSVAVAFVDLDRFKLVNNSLGHDAGDQLLRQVSERLTDALRDEDTAGRFGADEFVVLCEEVRSEQEALTIVERLRAAFAAPFQVDGTEMHVSAGIGIALASEGHGRGEHLIRDAHAALSRAKERGSGEVELFDEQLRSRAVLRLETERSLHRALEHGELRVHYQPEISLVDGSVVGVEALVRWEHPTRGMVGPTEFIPLAEETGLIDQLGNFVLTEACWQAAKWSWVRVGDGPLTVWVNVSARQLSRPDFVSRVSACLATSGAAAGSVGLEITESTLFEDVDTAVARLDELRALGVRLAVDDFGTGYSSLTYLRRLPIEVVKIDRSFVESLGGTSAAAIESSAIVAAVVSMARALDLSAVAEGAESPEHVAALADLGCHVAQGYWFARPAPPQAVEALLHMDPPPWLSGPGWTDSAAAQDAAADVVEEALAAADPIATPPAPVATPPAPAATPPAPVATPPAPASVSASAGVDGAGADTEREQTAGSPAAGLIPVARSAPPGGHQPARD